MRSALILALGLAAMVGAAHAQFQPYKPIEPPKNPYALPQIGQQHTPTAPSMAPAPPPSEGFKPFKPYKGVDTNTAPSGLYPELHKPKKKSASGF